MNPSPKSFSRPQWVGLALLFLLALIPRLVAVAQYEAHHPNADAPVIDERSYDAWGREIAAGDWLGDEVFFQEPLYPYFLGTVYGVVREENGRSAARLLQSVLGALAAVFVGLCARELFGLTAGFVAGLAFALLGPAIMFPAYLLKPNLFVPLLSFLAWLALRAKREARGGRWIVLGVGCGLGALLRGNMLILLPLLTLTVALVERRTKSVALFVGGALLVLVPVALRNYVVGDVFALTTSGAGTNLYGGNNADNPYGIAREFDWVRGIPEYEADDWRHEAERRSGREMDGGEVSRFWIGELLDSAAADPVLHLSILWNKLRATLSDYEIPDNHDLAWDARYVSLLRTPPPGWGFAGPFIIAGVFVSLLWPNSKRERLLALFFLAYLATIVLTVTSMRVRLGLLPLGLPLAAGLCSRIRDDLRSKRILRVAGGLLLGLVMVHALGPFDAAERERRLDVRDYNLATQWLEDGRDLEAARGIAADLRERHPASARTQSLWAELEAHEGLRMIEQELMRSDGQDKIRASLATLRVLAEDEALASKERFRARRLAAWIQLALNNGKASANQFQAALVFDREDTELWLGWIQASLIVLPSLEPAERDRLREEILTRIAQHLDPESPAARDLAQRARE